MKDTNFDKNNTKMRSSLGDDLTNKVSDVMNQMEDRMSNSLDYLLSSMVDKAIDQSVKIMSLNKPSQKDITLVISDEVVRCAEGNLCTPRYIEKAKADQEVVGFDGTCWKTIPKQKFKDFVNAMCRKMQIPDYLVTEPSFMNRLYERVAFRVMGEQKVPLHKGEVWMNLVNGTLVVDIIGCEVTLRPHCREDNFRNVLPYVYDPQAECVLFRKFLNKMLPEEQAQKLLAEYIGYGLTDGIKAEKMLVFSGTGGNGKSVMLEIIEALAGRENVSNVSLSDVTSNDKMRACIENKLINISYETQRFLVHSILKQLVSGEPITAYINYAGPITMTKYAKFISSFNELPKPELTHAFFRRWILMPWDVTISEEEKDVNLAKKIVASELPGILNWALEGLLRFLRQGCFTESPMCNKALEDYKHSADSVHCFLSVACVKDSSKSASVAGSFLYGKYTDYCRNEDLRPLGKQTFYTRLEKVAGVSRIMNRNAIMFPLKYNSDADV